MKKFYFTMKLLILGCMIAYSQGNEYTLKCEFISNGSMSPFDSEESELKYNSRLANDIQHIDLVANGAECLNWLNPSPTTGWNDFNTIFGGAPGSGCPFNEIDLFEVWASEAYSVNNFVSGTEYTFSMCNGPGAGSWVPDFTIISPSGNIDAFGEGDGCSITWTASESGTYFIVINESGFCGGGSNTSTDNGYPALTCTGGGGGGSFPDPYCGPLTFGFDVEPISRVILGDIIDNPSNPAVNGSPAHEDFTSIVGTMDPGESYPIALEGNTAGNFVNRFVVFIDWNQNGILNDVGEVYEMNNTIQNSNGTDGQQALGTISVPADAELGETRMRVKKIFGTTDFLNPCLGADFGQAEDYTINVNGGLPFPEPYCGPLVFTFDIEPISRVDVADIDNLSDPTVNGSPAHEDFTHIVGNMEQGESYPIALEGHTAGNFVNRFVVFIDWNQNGILNDVGEVYEMNNTIQNSNGTDGQQALGTISVPADAELGETRMRVKKIFGTTDFLNPCLGADFGQAEDYTINVSGGSGGGEECEIVYSGSGQDGLGALNTGLILSSDFRIIPEQTMTVESVTMKILSSVTSVNVGFLANNTNVPGAVIMAPVNIVPASQTVVGVTPFGSNIYEVVLNLPTPQVFEGGASGTNYWMTISTVAGAEGNNFWEFAGSLQNGTYFFYSPDGGASWVDASTAGFFVDGAFSLSGECEGGIEPEGCEWIVNVFDTINFGDEVSWQLRDNTNTVILSGGPYSSSPYNDTQTVMSENGPMTFYIESFGTWGDNTPNYTVTANGTLVLSGQLSGGSEGTHSGLECEGTTDPCAVTVFPFTETFENDSASRDCWTQIQEQNTASWTYATGSSGGVITTANSGTLNAQFVSINPAGNPHITKLVSPMMDLTSLSNPEVTFYYGQEVWAGDQNELKVYYRVSGSDPWVEIAHYTANVNSWTEEVLALPNPSATYQIAFEGINGWGRANVVDDVTVDEGDSGGGDCEPGDITTIFNGGNQFAGNMFDVTAIGGEDVLIEGFDINIDPGTATISVYTRPGTYVGFENSSAGWTLMGSEAVTSAGENMPTFVDIGGLTIPDGEVYGFYVTVTDYPSTNMNYTNGNFVYTDDYLQINTGVGKANPDFTGSTFASRSWNGTIYYCAGEAGSGGDCGTVFTDTGGPGGDYGNSENIVWTFNPGDPGNEVIVATFTEFNVENGWDNLYVHDGPDISAPLIATLTGTTIPGPITSTHPTGALTFNFISDSSFTRPGWVADITCEPIGNNDDCSGAFPLACGDIVTGTTVGMNNSGGNAAPDVFYSYTGSGVEELITVSLCDGTDYDSYLRVYSDCTLSNQIAFNDDFCGLQSELTFISDGTSTYFIMVEGFGSNAGNFTLELTCLPSNPVLNDDCDDATALSCGDVSTGNTTFANDSGGNASPDVFYSYTGSGEVEFVTVSLCASSYDTYLRIFSDCTLTNEIAFNDDSCGLQSQLTFESDGTSTYIIMVEGFGTSSGEYTIELTCAGLPGCGDQFTDSGGPAGNYSNNEDTVWTFTPDISGDVVTVTFTSFDVETGWDALYVFNGPDTSSPMFDSGNPATGTGFPAGGYYGTGIPGPFTSTHPTGALTFQFLSDGTVTNAGWIADIACGPYVEPNDECDNAIELSCGDIVTGDTSFASDTGGNLAADVYYTYTGSGQPEVVTLSLCGSSYDTYLRVFTECDLVEEIAFNDDYCGLQSQLAFMSDGTSTYVIMVEGFGSQFGEFTLEITCEETAGCGDVFTDTGGASNNYGANENITWYFTPAAGEAATLTFTSFDVEAEWDALYIYDGPDANSPLIDSGNPATGSGFPAGGYYGNTIPGPFTSSHPSGALTVVFMSDGSIQDNGWTADVSCEELGLPDGEILGFVYYPNPVSSLLNIKADTTIDSVELFNVLGQKVLSQNVGASSAQLNVSDFASGVYLMKVTSEGNTGTYQVIRR